MKRMMNLKANLTGRAALLLGALAMALAAGCGDDGGGGDGGEGGSDTSGEEGDATEGTPGEDSGESSDTGEGDTGDTTNPGTEICDNGIDDDGDNLVDCDDPDCDNHSNCKEIETICNDGLDNDGDSLIDCADPDCINDPNCKVEPPPSYPSCSDYYDCRVEQGCNCTIGVDCPTDQNAVTQCSSNCAQNPTCEQLCFSTLEPEFQQAFADMQTCFANNCGQLQGDAFVACVFDKCVDEYAACFQAGPETECSSYFECVGNCPTGAAGTACRSACVGELNADAWKDLVGWDNCRAELCDADDDNFFDSNECVFVGSFLACGGSDDAGSCRFWGTDGGSDCGTMLNCVTACASLGDSACIDACLNAASPEAFDAAGASAACVITTCGTTADKLTVACMKAALENECADEFETCTGGAMVEDCTNGVDDDGDGKVDCEDDDCSMDPACMEPGGEADARVIHLNIEAPAVDVFANGGATPVFSNLSFGNGTAYSTVEAGTYTFSVGVAGAPVEAAVLTMDPVDLMDGMSYTVAAFGTISDIKYIAMQDNRAGDVGEGQIHLRAVHAAVGVGQVDILVEMDGSWIPVIPDLDYAKASAYLPTAAGTYTVGIDTDNDGMPNLVYQLPALAEGSVVTAYAVAKDETVSLYAQMEDGTVANILPMDMLQ